MNLGISRSSSGLYLDEYWKFLTTLNNYGLNLTITCLQKKALLITLLRLHRLISVKCL